MLYFSFKFWFELNKKFLNTFIKTVVKKKYNISEKGISKRYKVQYVFDIILLNNY